VAELALEAGAEPGHVVDIIRGQHLIPATRTCAGWPWPIKVCVLGAASVTMNGEPAAAPGRSQVDLLRVLAVAGPAGRSQQSLERQLWPQSNTPQAALAVALHRLRKMFGNDHAVAAQERTITLSPELVWTDADAFAELCRQIEDLPDDAPQPLVRRFADQLLAIYRGNFDRDGDDPWYVAASARLRARFTAAAEMLGHRLEAFGDLKAAGNVYRRMLDTELLCETAYRGLMRIAHARGDSALAFAHYRLCRDTLSIVLNRPPSADTRRLAQALFPPQSPVGDTPANFATVSPACMAGVDEIASL
jgi:DNA-binding SARP family transcriptional activator